MADMLTKQDLVDGKIDVKHAGEAVNEKKIVTPRYGQSFKSIPLISEELQQILYNKDLEASQKVQVLQDAINTALAAGAGAAGWNASLVVDGDKNQHDINSEQSKLNSGFESIAEMLAIRNPVDGMRVFVKSYHADLNKGGGTFVYDSSKSSINDGVTILNGWKRSSFVYLTPEMAGAKGDGVTGDTTAWENILKLDLSIQCQKDSKYLTSRLLYLKNKAHIQLNGSRIINTTTSAFFAEEQFNVQVFDGSIHGLIEFGDFGPSVDDNRFGLCFRNCQKSMPNSLEIKGFGTGLWFLGVGNPATGEPVSYSKPIACITSHNYVGAKYSGDFGAEYLNALSCDSFKNYFCGLWIESGNFSATGGTTTSNFLHGVYLKAAANGGHGNINGMKINHNWGRNVLADSVQQGFIFNGCNIFDDNTVDKTVGAIEFSGCKGIKFNACQIMTNVIANGLNQNGDVLLNQFMNCEFYGTRGDFLSSDGSDNGVLFKDCTQGNEPFGRNSKGINFSYVNNVVSLVPVGVSLLRFNQIASAVGKKMLDVNSGIFVAQTTGIHTVSLNLICNKPFNVALLLESNVVANAIAYQQDASKYILNWTFNYYFEKNSLFNFAITNISDSAGALENSSNAYIYI